MNRKYHLKLRKPFAGYINVEFSDKGVTHIGWPRKKKPARESLKNQEGKNGEALKVFFDAFVSGDMREADKLKKKVKVDFEGTAFQELVWKAIRNICEGKVMTYKEIAQKIGRPKSVRAVGSACGKNPVPLLVPCHRVVASGGKLGGFSGKMDKTWLLAREGVEL